MSASASASATLSTLPIIDLSSPDRFSTAISIRQACIEYGFFYLVNHGVEKELIHKAFDESRKFFSLSLEEKMKLPLREHTGYTPMDPTLGPKGESKESYYIGPLADTTNANLNQWPSKELLTDWRPSMESFYWKLFGAGKKLLSLIALSLNMDEDFFEKIGAVNKPGAFLRLLHYPALRARYDHMSQRNCNSGELGPSEEICSAHSDFGTMTLLMTDGVPGLLICKDKFKQPQVWEDVPHIEGSSLHRVIRTGKERYSMAIFLDPYPDCVVECIESCCSESSPPRFPPIRCGDKLNERFRGSYV